MTNPSREFQIFAKPIGPICNLNCDYCYYLEKEHLYPKGGPFRMNDDILETYIVQHIEATTEPVIHFSWHGGEPTLLGIDYFRKIIALQRKYRPSKKRIINGIQTNGTLIDEAWGRFFAESNFAVGLSLDGPREMHDAYRLTKDHKSAFERTMKGYQILQEHNVLCEILCVVHAQNVYHPSEVYRFFKQLKARYITFLPLVIEQPDSATGVSPHSVPSDAWGAFLCTIFDEWLAGDIGRLKVQIFEEAVRPAFNQEHTLCLFKKTCGGVPVVEHNGDFYTCDHFVDADHRIGNITETPLVALLESPRQKSFGRLKWESLPRYCQMCEVREMCNGGCLKNRFVQIPDGEPGLNYLCAGYKTFFIHCRPFVEEVTRQFHHQSTGRQNSRTDAEKIPTSPKTGRNDPCPCGSGLKYKNCCMGKI
ncbi:anaerobic sulfatase maturase [bacterium]|nr:anaerobic sulfatase maturase [bacterium]